MRIRRQLVLPALVMVAGFGAFASAQTKKPAAKKVVKKVTPAPKITKAPTRRAA